VLTGFRQGRPYRQVLPVTLPELGVKDNRFEEMANRCAGNGSTGNFVPLRAKDVVGIYKLAS
jgi:hypothetical protein